MRSRRHSARVSGLGTTLRWLGAVAATLGFTIVAAGSSASGAGSSVLVTVPVLSATTLAVDPVGAPPNGCQTATSGVTAFGTVLPGTNAVTSSDCNVVWGSSNNSAMLRLYQADGVGRAMHATPCAATVACYRFNGNVTDGSRTANHATLAGGTLTPAYAAGHADTGQGLQFDGVEDEAAAPHDAALDLDTFTIDAWVLLDGPTGASGNNDYIVGKSTSGTNRNFVFGIKWSTATTAIVRADLSAGGLDISSSEGTTNLNDASWHHLALVVDSSPADPGKTERVYVDGVLERTRTFSGNVDNTATTLSIGHDQSSQTFPGIIDELRIKPIAATAAQIQSYIDDTLGPDDYDDDNVGSDANWTEGTQMFGACLETATDGAAGGAAVGGWTVAGDNNCTTASAAWNPVVATSGAAGSKVAAVTPGPDDDAAVTLRFGAKIALDLPTGTYEAPLVFEVVAPNA